jgi:hypothetical protein
MHTTESLAQMKAHKEPGAFLRALIMQVDSDERRRLLDNLTKAEREEKCIRRAVFFTLVVLLLSLAGLGYCAILQPGLFRNPGHPLLRSLLALVLGSLISQAGFLVYLLWHRAVVTRLHEECRRLVLALARTQLTEPASPSPAIHVLAQPPLNEHQRHS